MPEKDFNPEESYKALEQKFSQADKFAQHLINSLKKSKEADEEIKKIIRKLIKEDVQCKGDIQYHANTVYKEKSSKFSKEMWWKITTLLALPTFFTILGSLLTYFLNR